MPGLFLAVNANLENISNALSSLSDGDCRFHQIDFESEECFAGLYAKRNYPFKQYKKEGRFIIFEGMIYSGWPVSEEALFDTFFGHEGFRHDNIASFVKATDGEFVFLLVDSTQKKALLFNDRFGRLPLYIHKGLDNLVISRDIRFIKLVNTVVRKDKIAHAQNLLFGFSLGKRTLWEGIERFPPHAQLVIDYGEYAIQQNEYFSFPKQNKPSVENADIDLLINHLQTALQARISKLLGPALSLSGGLDSRLLAVLLAESKSEIPLFTYIDDEGSADADVIAVNEIIARLNLKDKHKFINIPAATEQDVLELLEIKKGLNGADMAFLLPYLKYFQQNEYSQITGDGGDKVLADLSPLIGVNTQNQLISYLLRKHTLITLKTVSALSGLSPDVIIESVRDVLNGYKLQSIAEQHQSFMLRERAMNWLFEGEDRNRFYSWSTTPFYNPDFFDLAMSLPMKEKAFGKLFLQLFRKLPANAGDIVNPNWNVAPSDRSGLKRLIFRQKIQLFFPEKLLHLIKKGAPLISVDEFEFAGLVKAHLNKSDSDKTLSKALALKLPAAVWYRMLTICLAELKSLSAKTGLH
jgi:asparagine synthase (glutamine-hydrolysing)